MGGRDVVLCVSSRVGKTRGSRGVRRRREDEVGSSLFIYPAPLVDPGSFPELRPPLMFPSTLGVPLDENSEVDHCLLLHLSFRVPKGNVVVQKLVLSGRHPSSLRGLKFQTSLLGGKVRGKRCLIGRSLYLRGRNVLYPSKDLLFYESWYGACTFYDRSSSSSVFIVLSPEPWCSPRRYSYIS